MKYRCKICGYVYDEDKEGTKFTDLPADWKCPVCGAPKDQFELIAEEKSDKDGYQWASEHVIGIAKDLPDDMKQFLRNEFAGECSEVGMYLAMSRAAIREGYAEIGLFFKQVAFEEAEHAAKYAEMLGEVVTDSTEKNLAVRTEAENGACKNKTDFAVKCKQMNLDALHDAIHEMARDEARHGKGFEGLLNRYFKSQK